MRFMRQIPAVLAIMLTLSACMPPAPYPPSASPTATTTRTSAHSPSPSQIPTASQTASPLPSATLTQTATATFTSTASAIPPTTQTPSEEPAEKPTTKPKRTRTATAYLRSTYLPDRGEQARGTVYLDSARLVVPADQPGTVNLRLTSNLPTPCHELAVEFSGPDASNQFSAAVYSLFWTNRNCIQVLAPFDSEVAMATGLPAGEYSLTVNGGEPLPFSIPLLE